MTKHRYNIHFGNFLDFTDITMNLSDLWEVEDGIVMFHSRHVDPREEINFYDVNDGDRKLANMTYYETGARYSGANYVYNWTADREFGWMAGASDPGISKVRIEGIRCINPDCDLEELEDLPIPEETEFWSNSTTWPDGVVPTSGSVEILPGTNVIYDLEDSPVFDVLTVNGQLSFIDDEEYLPNVNLNVKHIFVRAGNLLIGTEEEPYQAKASITLHGN